MRTEVGAVLGADPVGERVVVVRVHLGVPPDLQVPERVAHVQDQQADPGTGGQVLGLLPGGVERDPEPAVLVEEPDLGHLRPAVRADGGVRAGVGDRGAARCSAEEPGQCEQGRQP